MRELAVTLQKVLALAQRQVARLPREWLFGATIVVGLLVDQGGRRWPLPGEYLVDAFVWALFLTVFLRATRVERVEMIAVLVLATPLELLASETWGLYEYGRGLMPLFVPPGHWLLFAIGRRLAATVPGSWVLPASWLALPPVAAFALTGADTTGVVLFGLLVAFVRFGSEPALYVTMVGLALAMELLGTGLGNWAWASTVPGTTLSMTNPPLLCGTAYAFGDLLVGSAARFGRTRWAEAALD